MTAEDHLNAPGVKDSGLPPKPPVMHLCILANTIATEVSQITLKDGHIPSIRGHQHHGRNGLTDFLLEPAVWFKVLVVDVVVVNCVQRQLSWEISRLDDDDGASGSGGQLEDFCLLKVDDSRNGVRGSIRRPKAAKEADSMSAEDSFDLDEVFDCLPGLVVDYERNVITASQFHDSLMKFLHLYILPSIMLTSRHTVCMKEGLRQQEVFLQKVNDDIESTSRKLEAVTQSKTKIRRKFIPDINGSSHGDLPFSTSLIITLLNDINDEILDVSKDLEVAQDDVDRTKRMQKDSTTDDLAAARKTRNQIVQNYEELLRARENIVAAKNAMETTHRRRSRAVRKSDRPEHRIYEELTSIQGELIAVMQSLAEKKLLILSVKEAMKLTLAELELGSDSCGVDVETTGCLKAMDVLDNGSTMRSLWMTLTEQVDEIIANPNHSLTKQHRKFCSSVAERCKAAIGERMIYETMRHLSDDSSETQTTSSDVQDNDRSSSCTTLSDSIFYDTLSECCKVVVPDEGQRNGTKHPPPSSQGRGKGGGIFRKSRHHSGPPSTSGECNHTERGKTDSKTLYMLASSADDAVIVFEEDKNYARKAITTLQRDINRHFEDVAEQLRVELRQRSTTSLWLSYESHFYNETIDHILTLYALEYGAVTRTLGQTIRSLRATDLSFDDSILVRMLQEAENSVEDRTAVSDSSLDARSSDVQLSPRTKAEVDRSENMSQPDSDTPFKRLSSAANPEVDVEDFLPRLRLISESEAMVMDPKISSHPSRSKLRKLSNCESSPRTVRKSIKIAHPFSTVIVYDRTICSDPNPTTNETSSINGTSNSSKGTASSAIRKLKQEPARTMLMSPEYRRQFHQAFDLISTAVENRCLTTKFQQLTKCLRETSRQISIFCKTVRGTTGVATCCDELMDGVLLLLCNLDESVLSQLHVQIMMLSDLMPPFFQCNSFNFTLVQFVGAFQFLKDNILMRQQHTSSVVLRRC